jgi:hypothetical protein
MKFPLLINWDYHLSLPSRAEVFDSKILQGAVADVVFGSSSSRDTATVRSGLGSMIHDDMNPVERNGWSPSFFWTPRGQEPHSAYDFSQRSLILDRNDDLINPPGEEQI